MIVTAGSQEVGGRHLRNSCSVPASYYFELTESLPPSAPAQPRLPLHPRAHSPFGAPVVCKALSQP